VNRNPGPGTYEDRKLFNGTGIQFNSKYQSTGGRTISGLVANGGLKRNDQSIINK